MTHYAVSSTLAVFLLASLVLAVTPGPAVIYLVTRTLAHGRPAGLASIGGVALGNLGNAALASLGLAVVFAVSARAFTVVKLAGAAYLVYLGIRELRRAARERPGRDGPGEDGPGDDVPGHERPGRDATRHDRASEPVRSRAFRDGFLVALLNPKTALFFAAFLPQFVDPAGSPLAQTFSLGAIFVAIAACTDTLYVLAADRFGPKIAKLGGRPSLGRYVSGISFIALGVFVACSGSRSGK